MQKSMAFWDCRKLFCLLSAYNFAGYLFTQPVVEVRERMSEVWWFDRFVLWVENANSEIMCYACHG